MGPNYLGMKVLPKQPDFAVSAHVLALERYNCHTLLDVDSKKAIPKLCPFSEENPWGFLWHSVLRGKQ